MRKIEIKFPKIFSNPHFYTIAGTAAFTVLGEYYPKQPFSVEWGQNQGIELKTNLIQIYAFIGLIFSVVLPGVLKMPIVRGILSKFGLVAPTEPKK